MKRFTSFRRIERIQVFGPGLNLSSPAIGFRFRDAQEAACKAKAGTKSPEQLLLEVQQRIGGDLVAARQFLARLQAKVGDHQHNSTLMGMIASMESFVVKLEAEIAFAEYAAYKESIQPPPLNDFLFMADPLARQGTHRRSHHHKDRF